MSRTVDNLISSIGSLYLAIVSFILIYSYVSVSLLEHNRAVSNLAALDKLLALRYLAKPSNVALDEAKLKSLPDFYSNAAHAHFQEPLPDKSDKSNLDRRTEFTDETINGAYIRKNVPMRLAVGATCDALVTKLSPGLEFLILTFQFIDGARRVVGGTHAIKSENIQLISFHLCGLSGNPEFNALIFSLDDGQSAFAIPRSLEGQFPNLVVTSVFNIPILFKDFDKVKSLLPPSIAKYVEFEDSLITLHARAIDHYILRYAGSRFGKYYPVHDLEGAAQKLYEESEKDASYFGITTSGSSLVRFGPIIYFVLSFELWRRVRRLPLGKIKTEQYWFGLDSRDWIGRTYAYLSSLAPLLFGVLMYVLFATSQNLVLIVFDRVVSLQGVVMLQFPMAPLPGWSSIDYFAITIALIVVPLHFLILILTTWKLVHVVSANSVRA